MIIDSPLNLLNRSVFKIHGEDCFDFLQSVLTADLSPLLKGKCISSCLLSPQGRILFDFILYPEKNMNKKFSVLVDCDKIEKESLIKKLTMYKMRSNSQILDMPDKAVLICMSNNDSFKDPRHSQLPCRMIKDKDTFKKNDFLLNEFNKYRLKLCIAEGPSEMPRGEALPLDYWMDKTDQVSFEKGCFIGQEVIARIFHRNKIRRRLISVNIQGKSHYEENLPSTGFKFVFKTKEIAGLLAPLNFIENLDTQSENLLLWGNEEFNFHVYSD